MGEKTLSTRRSLFDRYKDMFFIVLGILSYSVGYTAFILPERVVMGGASGIAALIYYATNIQTWISLLILNCTFLLIALKALNLQFVVRTAVQCVVPVSAWFSRITDRREVRTSSPFYSISTSI